MDLTRESCANHDFRPILDSKIDPESVKIRAWMRDHGSHAGITRKLSAKDPSWPPNLSKINPKW